MTSLCRKQDFCALFTILNYSNKKKMALISERWKYEQSNQQVLDYVPAATDVM